jgi:hypothetical protein
MKRSKKPALWPKRPFLAVGALLALSVRAGGAHAGEPPQKLSPTDALTLKTVLLFPAPSELATRLNGAGVHVAAIPRLNERVPAPDWDKLAAQDRQLQLGSILGYLAFAAATGNMTAVATCFDQVLRGAQSLGVDPASKAYTQTLDVRDRIRNNQISSSQVLTRLDDLRRDTLRELATRGDLTFILAAAWLRGSSLLAEQVKTDADAAHLAEFVMRPELIDFIGRMPDPGSSAPSPQRRSAADRALAIAGKTAFHPNDFSGFVAFADQVFPPDRGRP